MAFDMMALFAGAGGEQSTGGVKALGRTFLDLCKTYDFEVYAFGDDGFDCAYGDYEAMIDAMIAGGQMTDAEIERARSVDVAETKDEFLQKLGEYIK